MTSEESSSTTLSPQRLEPAWNSIMGGTQRRDDAMTQGDTLPPSWRPCVCPSWRRLGVLASLRPCVLSQEDQCPECVEHQNRLAPEHHGTGGGPAPPFRASPGVEALEAPHRRHGGPEARALDQAEPDVLGLVELPRTAEELHRGEIEDIDRGEPAGEHPERHRHGGHRGQYPRSLLGGV